MKGKMENKYGKVLIQPDVIATYAGSVAVELPGIVGMTSLNIQDGIARLLRKEHITRGVKVDIDDQNCITLEFHVVVAYGSGIMTVCDNLIDSVKYKVAAFTGMTVKYVDVIVEGVKVID